MEIENTEIKEINEPKTRKKYCHSKRKSDVAKRKAAETKRANEKKKKQKQALKLKEYKKTHYEYNGKFLPYTRAKQIVKVLQLKSKDDYIRWYRENKPDYLPARPDNCYSKDFEGWIKFLSKDNINHVKRRLLEEKNKKDFHKQLEKNKVKETKKVKKEITAKVRYELKQADIKIRNLERREATALKKIKKNKKKEERLANKPVVEKIQKYKPKGRKPLVKLEDCLSYDEAKNIIAHERFQNIKEYMHWWELNKPAGIPKRPDRVYKENFSWIDYLSKDPSAKLLPFQKHDYREKYLPFEEARRYAHSLGIKNQKQWDDAYKEGKIRKDVPRFPHQTYQYKKNDPEWGKWYTWEDWLGDINSQLEIIKEKQPVIIVIMPKDVPQGVYSFIYRNDNEKNIDKFIDDNELYVIRIYKIDIFDWTGYLTRRYNNYYGTPNTFEIPNINQVLFDFDSSMHRIL